MSMMTGSFCGQALTPVESSFLSGSRARSGSGAPGDARRFVSMLRGEPEVGGTGTLACSTNGCTIPQSIPFGAWEPGDRGSAPSSFGPWGPKSPLGSARGSHHLQLDALAERVGSVVAGLQRQCDADKRTSDRRFQQVEKQLQVTIGRLEGDQARDGDWREKFSLVQGSISGLVDESQALSRRLDSLDERLWSRTSNSEEIARQGSRELSAQLQAFERQARLSAAAVEEAQKRQTTRQRRAESMFEDVASRLALIEDRCGITGDVQTTSAATEMRIQDLEAEVGARLQALEVCANNIQLQLDALHLANSEDINFGAVRDEECSEDGLGGTSVKGDLRGAIVVVEDDMRALERRLSAQLEELSSSVASLRVKAEGQMQRQSALSERLETAHVPALEALRNDVMEVRSRDVSEMRGQISELERKLNLNLEGLDVDPLVEKMERLTQRVSSGEATASALRREVHDLRGNLDRRRGSMSRGGVELAAPTIQEQLGAVADQLEALDDLSNRVSLLDVRVCGLEEQKMAVPHATGPVNTGASLDRDGDTPPGSPPSNEREASVPTLSQRRGGNTIAPLARLPVSTEIAAPSQSSTAKPNASLNSSPPPSVTSMSRKQSLESNLSCEVAVEQDEYVETFREDVLGERCDVTLEVISPSQDKQMRSSPASAQSMSQCSAAKKADDSPLHSSCHESFEDEDIISSHGSEDF